MPLHSEVHVDRPLSNFAVAYQNNKLIAPMISPWVPVNFKTDSYYRFNKKDNFTIPEDIRGPKDYANEVDWGTSTSTYACVDRALRHFLPDSVAGNADSVIQPRRRTTNLVTNLLLLAYEVRIMTLTTTYGNYGANYRVQLSGGDRWDVYATSDPIGNAETAREACFVPPNKCFMGQEVWNKLKHHPQILDRISGGSTNANPAMVTKQLVAELFEVDEIIVGGAKRNTANKAQTATYSYIWGKDVVFAYVADNPSLEDVSAFKTFRWNQQSTGIGYVVKTYRDEAKGGGGTWIEVMMSYDEEAVATDTAYIIDTVIS